MRDIKQISETFHLVCPVRGRDKNCRTAGRRSDWNVSWTHWSHWSLLSTAGKTVKYYASIFKMEEADPRPVVERLTGTQVEHILTVQTVFDFPVCGAARRLRTRWNGMRRTERPFQAAWPTLRTGCGFGAEVNEVSVRVRNL